MLIPFGIFAASGAGVASDFELIQTTIMPSTATSLTLSNLHTYTSSYKHLQVRISAKVNRTAGGDDLTVRFNGDSGANYSTHILLGSGSSFLAYGYGGGSMFVTGAAGSSLSTSTAGAVIDIVDAYNTSKHKGFRALSGESPGVVCLGSGSWNNTAVISSIQFLPVYSTEILAGSRFSIYGLKG
jgi:hypothetical protein